MSKPLIKTYRSLPWLILSFAIISSVACLVTGIITLALWTKTADIPLGVLTVVFGVWGMGGSITSFVLLLRQNKLNREQDRFLNHLVGDLRIPLSSIRLYAEKIASNPQGEETVDLAEHLRDEVTLLERLTLRVEGHVVHVKEIETMQPEQRIRKILTPFFRCSDYRSRLSFESEKDIPSLRVDGQAFENAVTCLVKNALQYGGEGQVAVSLRRAGHQVILEVKDEGKGLDEAFLRQFAVLTEKGRNAVDVAVFNFGLGLFSVHEFALSANARFRARNAEAGGAVFELLFSV